MEITKERQLEILQHKIDFCTDRYNIYIAQGISIKKINKMDMLRDEYIASKAIIEAT